MNNTFDYIIVGSGINALVCAALLGKSGSRVAILERNDRIGGCIRTDEMTLPGFKHDVMSSWHPLFLLSPAYAALGDELAAHGLKYCHTQKPTAGLLNNNTGFVLTTDRANNIDAMNLLHPGDGDRYLGAMQFIETHAELTFATLGEHLWSFGYVRQLLKNVWKRGLLNFSTDVKNYAESARNWLARDIQSPEVAACLAPWVLHTGLSPDSPFSGHMAKIVSFSLEAVGTPVVEGGSQGLLDAFHGLLTSHGTSFFLNTDVDEVIVEGKTATGVKTLDGTSFSATKAVICSTTPSQLYAQLLRRADVPTRVLRGAENFRHGLADMQIHIALGERPKWINPEMAGVAMVHVQQGASEITTAINEARSGLLPKSATIVVGQPCAVDPTRAPADKWILWIQLQELPTQIRGDAAGLIEPPSDGMWNDEIKEKYADRIIERLRGHIENLDELILERKVMSPADLQALNINLVGGDPYGGDCAMDQFLFWRPLAETKNHQTPFKSLFHIGASTHPGPGLGGGSGFLVGQQLSK